MSNLSEKQEENKLAYIEVKRVFMRGGDMFSCKQMWLQVESSVFSVGAEKTMDDCEFSEILHPEQVVIVRMALDYIQYLQNQSAKYS